MKKALAIMLVFVMCLTLLPMTVLAADASGTCGDNLTWTLSGGTLTISGKGAMENYKGVQDAPWHPYADKITRVVVEPGVTSVGDNAFFADYSALTDVKLADGVERIGHSAFFMCPSLTSVELPNSVKSIDDYGFGHCDSLTNVVLPDSLESLGAVAFECCYSLKSIVIPDGIESIGYSTFGSCTSLTSVEIPGSVKSIDGYAFVLCESLTSIVFSEGLESIDDEAFSYCTSLTSIELPSSLKSIGGGTFGYCESLTSVVIPDGVESIWSVAFRYCTSLTNVELPNSVNYIGTGVFEGCESLTGIVLPDGLESISDVVFSDCVSLTSVTIPASVKSIGYSAFRGCSALSDVYYGGSEEQWAQVEIDNSNNYNMPLLTATIHFNTPIFTDVPYDAYYADAVAWAVANGVTTGATSTTFEPEEECTRGQVVTFLWRAMGCPEPTGTANLFTDVDSGEYYYKAVLWAVEDGITTGATPTTFEPEETCTRAQVVTFLYRLAGEPAVTGGTSFTDVPAGEYYVDAVAWAVSKGVTTGATPATFEPEENCLRCQVVTFLYRDLA